ncbi:MAG: ATP-binding protein [Clostridiales bacterium]|nr:ATP-binding protein [Clostridiales bacterium]
MSNNNVECIKLSLPLNSAYVSAARLTASSVANRLGFETDEIEDIKAAVSESCTYIIKKQPIETSVSSAHENFTIKFFLGENALSVEITTHGPLSGEQDGMSIIMIKALMDDVTITEEPDGATIIMSKEHKESRLFE